MNNLLLLNKPPGPSTYDLIRDFKKANPDFKDKLGHAGTLDPFADGLVILLLGKATKTFSHFQTFEKTYQATAELGFTSPTLDTESEVTVQMDSPKPSRAEIESTLKQFVGDYEQQIPVYSAIKIDGQPAYKKARTGQLTSTNRSKIVTIHSLKLISYDYPKVVFEARVSSGTYIRQLTFDIFQKLGINSMLTALKRTKIGKYSLIDAISKEDLYNQNWTKHLLDTPTNA